MRLPLSEVEGWQRTAMDIRQRDGKYFTVVGVRVGASNREIGSWSQPLLSPVGRGLLAFVTKRIDGVLHILVQARTEAGTLDVIEMAPTVHCTPDNFRDTDPDAQPPFLRMVLDTPPSRIRHEVVHSEEGGRFHHAENRYLVVEAGDEMPVEVPDDFIWITARQAMDLVRHGNYFNVQARSLLACMNALW